MDCAVHNPTRGIDVSASTVICGDAFDALAKLPTNSIDLIVTSPPYWGLRDYEGEHNWDIYRDWLAIDKTNKERVPTYEWYREHGGMLGLEPLPEWYINNLASFFDAARAALKPGGSVWLNIGDTYFARWSSIRPNGRQGLGNDERLRRKTPMGGFRQEKQLLLIPARVAIELQSRKWILRNDLIWYKPNVPPRPEKDRLALTHEHFFHFVKKPTNGRATYYYDIDQCGPNTHDVFTQNVRAGKAGHSATFPEGLITNRIMSSSPVGGTVLDPFCGTGTTLVVAHRSGRIAIGIDANERYARFAAEALKNCAPLLL
jgi:site-specific DNA-methyltransferase (cytosine-N4-specific)